MNTTQQTKLTWTCCGKNVWYIKPVSQRTGNDLIFSLLQHPSAVTHFLAFYMSCIIVNSLGWSIQNKSCYINFPLHQYQPFPLSRAVQPNCGVWSAILLCCRTEFICQLKRAGTLVPNVVYLACLITSYLGHIALFLQPYSTSTEVQSKEQWENVL